LPIGTDRAKNGAHDIPEVLAYNLYRGSEKQKKKCLKSALKKTLFRKTKQKKLFLEKKSFLE